MAISTGAELFTAVANFLADDSLTSRVGEFITLGEARIWYGVEAPAPYPSPPLRARQMQTRLDITVDAQAETLSSDYLDTTLIFLDGDPVRYLEHMSPVSFWQTWTGSNSGKPKAFTIYGSQILYGPSPDGTYTGEHWYYAKPTALANDAVGNWLLTASPGVYLYAALLEAQAYLQDDEQVVKWYQAYTGTVAGMNAASKSSTQGGLMIPRTGRSTP